MNHSGAKIAISIASGYAFLISGAYFNVEIIELIGCGLVIGAAIGASIIAFEEASL